MFKKLLEKELFSSLFKGLPTVFSVAITGTVWYMNEMKEQAIKDYAVRREKIGMG